MGPIQQQITDLLNTQLKPSHLDVINESHMHNVPEGSEMHFKLIIVSDAFVDKRLVQRHQLVYGAIQALINNPVHAISIHAFTPEEWQREHQISDSPPCHGRQVKDKSESR